MIVDIFNTDKKYKIILADPPWSFKTYSDKGKDRSADNHYDIMNIDDIKKMPVKNIADKNCILFLWVTSPCLEQAFGVIKSWGFQYKTIGFNWTKTLKNVDLEKLNVNKDLRMNLGYYTRCVSGDSEIYIKHKKYNNIQNIKIQQLSLLNYSDYQIWTPTGWSDILNFVKNSISEYAHIKTAFNDIKISLNHKLLWKYTDNSGHNLAFLTVNEILRKKESYKKSSINLIFNKKPIEKNYYIENISNFKLNNELAWILGIFCAEGSYHGKQKNNMRFTFHRKEINFHERIKSYINSLNIKGDRYYKNNIPISLFGPYDYAPNTIVTSFTSKKLVELTKNFIIGHGSHYKRLNLDLLLQTSSSFRQSFLQGMLDGDGYKEQNKYQRMVLCNKELINDFSILAFSLGIQNKNFHSETNTWSSVSGDIIEEFKYKLQYIYPRNKKLIYNNNLVEPIEIKDIEIIKKPLITYDITVDNEVFIVNNIISHNSNPEMCLLAQDIESSTEICFIGRKGAMLERKSKSVRQAIISPMREHSRKPDEIYGRIESLFDGPYIELFARQERVGWDVFGNEVNKFNESN